MKWLFRWPEEMRKVSTLLEQLRAQGMSVEDAIKLLQAEKAAEDAKGKGVKDPIGAEEFRRIIDEVVNARMKDLGFKAPDQPNVMPGPLGDPDEREVAKISEDVWLLSHMMRVQPKSLNAENLLKAYRRHQGVDYRLASIRKALDTTDASALVPTGLATALLADVENKSPVMANIRIIDMPTNPWESPYQSASMTIYGVDESTDDDASAVKGSNVSTAKITFNAKKLGARALWSRELDEDSAVAILPMLRTDFIRITRDGWERAFIFGDETTDATNINQEGTAPTTTAGQKDHWLQADGMVHHCLITNSAQSTAVGAAFDKTKYNAVRKLMGKYGDAAGDLLAFVTRDLFYDIMATDEVVTLEKYGPGATILTGELARYMGSPLMVSDGLPLTDTTGKIDDTAADNVKKSLLLVNRAVGVIGGRRGELRIEVDTVNKTDQYEGIVFSRYDIQFPFVKGLAYGYNIT